MVGLVALLWITTGCLEREIDPCYSDIVAILSSEAMA
jgi:hypothetical protein